MRKVYGNIFQGNFLDAHNFDGKTVSVAEECAVNPELHLKIKDYSPIDFWDFVRVVAYLEVKNVQGVKTLIHCCAGANRSVLFSVAYLLYKGFDMDKAFSTLGLRREDYINHPGYKSLEIYAQRIRDPVIRKFIRYMMVQFEALTSSSDPGMSELRAGTLKKYVDKGKVLIIGCTKEELNAFSKYFETECIHVNPVADYGKFIPFEYNEYPDKSFDAVVAFDVIEHTLMPFAFIGEVWRVLKEGGIFYHSTPTISNEMKTPWHINLNSAEGLRWLFDWFDFEVIEEKEEKDRLTQILRKDGIKKMESYKKLLFS